MTKQATWGKKVELENGKRLSAVETAAGFVMTATLRGDTIVAAGKSLFACHKAFNAASTKQWGSGWSPNGKACNYAGIQCFELKPVVARTAEAIKAAAEARKAAREILEQGDSHRIWRCETPKGNRYLRVVRFVRETQNRQADAFAVECDRYGKPVNVVRYQSDADGEMRTMLIRASVGNFGTAYVPLKTRAASAAM